MSMLATTNLNMVAIRAMDVLLGINRGPVSALLEILVGKFGGVRSVEESSVDERLKRLDEARGALAESLSALDELKIDAERSKAEYDQIKASLETVLASKADADKQLSDVRKIINGEISAFQVVAGVPNLRKERGIGFLIGFLASLLCTVVWASGHWMLTQWGLIP